MLSFVYVGLGGALGSMARYGLTSWLTRMGAVNFPYGTLAVNIVGSFLMGVLIAAVPVFMPEKLRELHLFIAVGVLGGFTTFSAFSLDTVTLFQRGEVLHALLYVVASVVLSVAGLYAGILLMRGALA